MIERSDFTLPPHVTKIAISLLHHEAVVNLTARGGVPRISDRLSWSLLKARRQPMPSHQSSEQRRWDAAVGKDRRADGEFFYSVRTTGVYCRPSCPARIPRRKNVAYHASCEAAEAKGFRACKRC